MPDTRELANAVGSVLENVRSSVKEHCFEPSEFFKAFSEAKRLCLNDTENLQLSSRLLTVLCRTQSLYGSLAENFAAYKAVPDNTADTVLSAYSRNCLELASDTAGLFSLLANSAACPDTYVAERNLVFSRSEALRFAARELRTYIISGQKKIFRVLPKLEYVYSCEAVTQKCTALCRAYDTVNHI